jgi:hypothetical protein
LHVDVDVAETEAPRDVIVGLEVKVVLVELEESWRPMASSDNMFDE